MGQQVPREKAGTGRGERDPRKTDRAVRATGGRPDEGPGSNSDADDDLPHRNKRIADLRVQQDGGRKERLGVSHDEGRKRSPELRNAGGASRRDALFGFEEVALQTFCVSIRRSNRCSHLFAFGLEEATVAPKFVRAPKLLTTAKFFRIAKLCKTSEKTKQKKRAR